MRKAGQIFYMIGNTTMLAIIMAIMFVMIGGCTSSQSYITSEPRPVYRPPTTNKAGGTRVESAPVECRTGKAKCTDNRYYLCAHVSLYCGPCRNEKRSYSCTEGSGEAAREATCHRTVRVCAISDINLSPSRITTLVQGEIPNSVLKSTTRCSSRWVAPLGRRSGNFWAHISDRDDRCENSMPIEQSVERSADENWFD